MDIETTVRAKAKAAQDASRTLALASTSEKDGALAQMAERLGGSTEAIRAANEQDMRAGADRGLSRAMLDRLLLTDARIEDMVASLRAVTDLPDPVGRVRSAWRRPNGIQISKVTVPIGAIGVIYESRPNVTVEATSLCLKAGNAVLLRGGSEAIHSNTALALLLAESCAAVGLPGDCVQFIDVTDRAAVVAMLKMHDCLDLIVPRGGESLIRTVAENTTIPTLKHDRGLVHIYVDASADVEMATRIVHNAKVQRPGVCNAVETLLLHADAAPVVLPAILTALRGAEVQIRGCSRTREIAPDAVEATEQDWDEEYLDLVLAVRIVDDMGQAIEHIRRHGSGLAEAIVTADYGNAQRFLDMVDSATVYVNASTRFTDGGQFGLGAEIGISTSKLHARGPMALEELTSTKYIIRGSGQVRE
ncbi:MAG: glutamate-5-semialdehyde dehydrogenase [Armatimonadota bacterium]|jgi:glutamate-5-semialdehyde dehydrogenase